MGAIANKNGTGVSSFHENLSFTPEIWSSPGNKIVAHSRLADVEPGIYQVRVAARDPGSGSIGCVWEWIDMPALAARKIELSSIFLREQREKGTGPGLTPDTVSQGRFSIQNRFSASAHLSYFVNIYNAAGPEVQLQTTIYRIAVQSTPQLVETGQDGVSRAQVTINNVLPIADSLPGSYTLEVTATDRSTNRTATQRVAFVIQPPP